MDRTGHTPPCRTGRTGRTAILLLALMTLTAAAPAQERRPGIDEAATRLPPVPAAVLSLDELVNLSRQGVDSGSIIARIRSSGSYYRLAAGEVISLHQRGLPLAVIDHMLSAERVFLARAEPPAPAVSRSPVAEEHREIRPRQPIPALYIGL